MTERLRFFYAWHSLGWGLIVLVIYMSLTPAPLSIAVEGGDRLGHAAAYATLMAWFSWLYARTRVRWACALGFAALRVGLEFTQALMDYRSFELADMAADCLGVGLGWIGARLPLPNFLVVVERHLLGAYGN